MTEQLHLSNASSAPRRVGCSEVKRSAPGPQSGVCGGAFFEVTNPAFLSGKLMDACAYGAFHENGTYLIVLY